jgi:hypothetical protein
MFSPHKPKRSEEIGGYLATTRKMSKLSLCCFDPDLASNALLLPLKLTRKHQPIVLYSLGVSLQGYINKELARQRWSFSSSRMLKQLFLLSLCLSVAYAAASTPCKNWCPAFCLDSCQSTLATPICLGEVECRCMCPTKKAG